MKICKTHKNCVNNAVKKAEKICKKQVVNFTDHRREVLKLLWQDHKPVKAYDLLKKIKTDSVQPPKIYRALEFLLENGLAHKINSLNAYAACSHPLEHANCYFLICTKCEKISEFCDQNLERLIKKNADKNKFKPQKLLLEITGLCADCQKEKER